jgi:predicted ribosomally synthesized peptide with nif11-like leader
MKTIQAFFADAVAKSPELQAKISAAKNSAEIVKLAAIAGYTLTEEAIVNFIAHRAGTSEELSDSDLASVAGGLMPNKPITDVVTSSGVTRCCW